MYIYIPIVILVLVMKGESSVIALTNEPVLTKNSVFHSESKSEISWDNHVMDFIQLIDMQKWMGVGIKYMSDEEVLNFVAFVSSMQFKEIVLEFESLAEFREASTYLASKGYDVNELINYINSALDLPPYQKLIIHGKNRKGITGLIEELIETLPLDDIKTLFESKLLNYPEIADIFQTINSVEFLDIMKRLSQNPHLNNYKTIFESYGFDFKKICEMAVKIFGEYYQGVFCG